jgi:hypothetical protein
MNVRQATAASPCFFASLRVFARDHAFVLRNLRGAVGARRARGVAQKSGPGYRTPGAAMLLSVLGNLTLFVGALAMMLLFAFFCAHLHATGLGAAARFAPGLGAALLMCLGGAEVEFKRELSVPMMVAGWMLLGLGAYVACA